MRTDPEAPQGRAGYLIRHTQLAEEPLPSISLQTTLPPPWQEGAVLHARHPGTSSSLSLQSQLDGHGSRAQFWEEGDPILLVLLHSQGDPTEPKPAL